MNSSSVLSPSVEQLDLTYKGYTYAQKQQPFKALIQSLEQSRSSQLENVCREYVRRYPFNTTIWNSLAQQIKVSHSAQESENVYREGVAQNSRSLELWQYFFSAIKSDNQEESKLNMLYEEAVSKVGFDFNSSALWDELIRLSSNNSYNKIETFNLYRRVLAIPIKNLDNFRDKFNAFFSTFSPEQVLLAYQQTFAQMPDAELSQEGMSHQIKLALNAAADKSKALLTEVASFEIKLSKTEFDGQSTSNDLEIWNQYLHFARQRFAFEHIIFLYEKALISNCDKLKLWEDYFSYLDSQSKNTEALEVARKLNYFFKSLQDSDLLLLLAELEELNGNSSQARELYQSIEGELSVKSCTRWSQFEDRVGSGLSSEVFEKMIANPSGMRPETYAWAINRLAKALLNNTNSTKQSALNRYLALFETGPISKIGYSQLLCFLRDNFVNEPDFINSLAEIYVSTLQTVKKVTPGDMKDYVTLSRSHLRTVAPTLAELRKIENRIRGTESGQFADTEGLNAKRNLAKLLGEECSREVGQEPFKQIKVL